jgi:mycofactocin precursor
MDANCDAAPANAPGPACPAEPAILEEIEVEDLAVDGICGVY